MLRFPAWKVAIILVVIIWGAMLALPNLLTQSARDNLPGFMPKAAMNLGLDLRGGSYLLIELDDTDARDPRLLELSSAIQENLILRSGEGGRINHEVSQVGSSVQVKVLDADKLGAALSRVRAVANDRFPAPPGGGAAFTVNRLPDNVVEVRLTSAGNAQGNDLVASTISVIRKRVDPQGVTEVSITPQGENRIVLEAPGESDPQRIKDLLSQAGQLSFHLVIEGSQRLQPTDENGLRPMTLPYPEIGPAGTLIVDQNDIMTGADVQRAYQAFNENGEAAVSFTLNNRGTRAFAETTRRYVNERFAIVLDGAVISAPNIREPIIGGTGQISGSFTIESATDLAAIIAAGQLRADLVFVEERSVGPGLGADSISAGTWASIIGLILVAAFMILAYGIFGVFAVTSLAVNIVLILGALSGLGATLTLPGIAGIILTIGMAVDANVLVFERVREEQRAGRSPMSALQKGYESALSTILDANVTTLIAALVLFQLGSGPVKGFAVTLAIGIFSSVFTAFVVTRWLTVSWMRWARPKKLPI